MSDSQPTAKFSYDGLDRLFHEKARLGILTSLATNPKGLTFSELKQLCALTDGNLSRHLKMLEEANVVAINKRFEHNRPLTTCVLTPTGRGKFLEYITVLENVVRDAAQSEAGETMAFDNAPLKPA